MGVLVVHCPNRPEDEMIDCGVYGMHLNMHSHNMDSVKGEVLVGVPVSTGKKLPAAGAEDDKTRDLVATTRAWAAGAVVGTEVSGIPSTFLPGGIEPPEAAPEERPKADSKETAKEAKSAQAKEGGE